MQRKANIRFVAFTAAVALVAGAVGVSIAQMSEAGTDDNRGHLIAYVWADNPRAPSYTPSERYRFTSSRSNVTISRASPGAYAVKLGNLSTPGGHAQVTAYGAGADHCKVVRWGLSGKDQEIHVACFAANGTPDDTQFTLAFFD